MKKKPTIWQIGSGERTRPYADIFLRYGVGLIGPGDPGSWTPERVDEDYEGGFVRWIASEVETGDVFLLRTGASMIAAIGIVAGKYEYLKEFDDVNGWDLQHARRVRWCILPKEYNFGEYTFAAQPSRFSRCWNNEVIQYVEKFLASPPTQWQTAPLPDLPKEEPSLDDIPHFLQDFLATVRDVHPLFWDRQSFGDHPTEDELVGHFVLPFLKLLGWPPELISVKWNNIDVALFSKLPRIPENCYLIIEAKRLGAGVEGALSQAKDYLKNLGIERDIVVTDGIRYRMYSYTDSFNKSVAYANFMWLKQPAIELINRLKRN